MTTSPWLRLAGRVAVVTGAGSGIGATVSYALASQGCHVILADTNREKAEAVAKLCSSRACDTGSGTTMQHEQESQSHDSATPIYRSAALDVSKHEFVMQPHAVPVQCDVCQTSDVRYLIECADNVAKKASMENHGASPNTLFVDAPLASILVNCAGITRDSLISDMTQEEFDQVINVNLKGTFLTCKYFSTADRLEALASSPTSSSIINISSIVGTRGNVGQTNYAASKAGVYGLTKSLAKELARYNVRANAILPGFIDTPMSAKVPERIRNHMISNIPMKRFGTTENVSDLILFLASERSAYITGEGVEISGAISF